MCAGERVEIVTLDEAALRELLTRIRTGEALDSGDRQLIEDVLKAYCWLSEQLEAQDVSVAKLQQMLFGVKSERKDAVFPPEKGAAASAGTGEQAGEGEKKKRKGHGRNGVSAYPGAERVPVAYQGLSKGCRCPSCERGKVYGMRPERIVRIVREKCPRDIVFSVECGTPDQAETSLAHLSKVVQKSRKTYATVRAASR